RRSPCSKPLSKATPTARPRVILPFHSRRSRNWSPRSSRIGTALLASLSGLKPVQRWRTGPIGAWQRPPKGERWLAAETDPHIRWHPSVERHTETVQASDRRRRD